MSQLEDKPENYFLITNKLTEEQGKTRLTLTQENVPNEEQKEHSEQNWKMVLGKMKKLVEEGK